MNSEPDARAVIERYLHDVLATARSGAADGIAAAANLRQSLNPSGARSVTSTSCPM